MCTNVGERKMDHMGKVLGLEDNPWPDKESMGNMLCFAQSTDWCWITHNNWKEDTFTVHTENEFVYLQKNQMER